MPAIQLPPEFVLGATKYQTSYDDQPRIVVPVMFRAKKTSLALAIVDTAATRCLINTETASFLGLQKSEGVQTEKIISTFGTIPGWITRVELEFVVEEGNGDSLTLESPFFVPDLESGYTGPTFLGMIGLLEAMRFAVDPGDSLFYFGDR